MYSINWVGVIWLAMWVCIFIGSILMAIVETAHDKRAARKERARKRRIRKRDRRALADRWRELIVG